MYTYIHTYVYIHKHIYTYIHIYTHTHTPHTERGGERTIQKLHVNCKKKVILDNIHTKKRNSNINTKDGPPNTREENKTKGKKNLQKQIQNN